MFEDIGDVLDYMDAVQQGETENVAAELTEELSQDFCLEDTKKDDYSLEKIDEWMQELEETDKDIDEESEYERWERER